MGDKSWFVYMVRCQNNALYTGITTDLDARVKKHNSGKGSKSVRAHGLPVTLEWSLKVVNRSVASKYECDIKKMSKSKKEDVIKSKIHEFFKS